MIHIKKSASSSQQIYAYMVGQDVFLPILEFPTVYLHVAGIASDRLIEYIHFQSPLELLGGEVLREDNPNSISE